MRHRLAAGDVGALGWLRVRSARHGCFDGPLQLRQLERLRENGLDLRSGLDVRMGSNCISCRTMDVLRTRLPYPTVLPAQETFAGSACLRSEFGARPTPPRGGLGRRPRGTTEPTRNGRSRGDQPPLIMPFRILVQKVPPGGAKRKLAARVRSPRVPVGGSPRHCAAVRCCTLASIAR